MLTNDYFIFTARNKRSERDVGESTKSNVSDETTPGIPQGKNPEV